MQATVTDTYQGERTAQMCMLVTRMCVAVYYWFFISYRYLVGVIFSNLILSILVSAFQTSVEDAATLQGQVRLRLRDCGSEMLTAKQQVKLQRELGAVARMHIDAKEPDSNKQELINQAVLDSTNDATPKQDAMQEPKQVISTSTIVI